MLRECHHEQEPRRPFVAHFRKAAGEMIVYQSRTGRTTPTPRSTEWLAPMPAASNHADCDAQASPRRNF